MHAIQSMSVENCLVKQIKNNLSKVKFKLKCHCVTDVKFFSQLSYDQLYPFKLISYKIRTSYELSTTLIVLQSLSI